MPAIAAYVDDRPVAWIDDVIVPEAIAWAQSRSAPTLLVQTDPTLGMQHDHVDHLLAWAAALER